MIERVEALSPYRRAAVERLVAHEEGVSGRHPLDEVNRLALVGAEVPPRGHWLLWDSADPPALLAYAVSADDVAELSARDTDAAVAVLEAVRSDGASHALWAHGQRSAAQLAADRQQLPVLRELTLFERPLSPDPHVATLPAGVSVRAFEPQQDSADWLALNRTAFVDLPDQSSWTREDLDLRLAAPWFDQQDFLIARTDDGFLAGFHWTKIDPADPTIGEVFVIAVSQRWRGTGLAQALLDRGLAHLYSRGARRVQLYVDRANTRAVALYERADFTLVDTDRHYAL
jgi:mycothiol synthase